MSYWGTSAYILNLQPVHVMLCSDFFLRHYCLSWKIYTPLIILLVDNSVVIYTHPARRCRYITLHCKDWLCLAHNQPTYIVKTLLGAVWISLNFQTAYLEPRHIAKYCRNWCILVTYRDILPICQFIIFHLKDCWLQFWLN